MTDPLFTIVLDTHGCNGCGGCVELCPELFRMDEAGEKAELLVLRAPLSPALAEAIKMCARQCLATEVAEP
ncbi:ferredoxin [Desulfurivibrio sp. D14AmB]|uniref:ferredoxin n=1 Tax=Desulfurivibrio sp. D14AmB TaxID=3374370 RepID=UPI00376EE4D1